MTQSNPTSILEPAEHLYVVKEVPTPEQQEVLQAFADMLAATSKDGGRKRAAGLKPSWKVDKSHEAAIFSHLNKWKHGETVDPESGQHPLVHMAWRALAIAWQETHTFAQGAEGQQIPRTLTTGQWSPVGGASNMAHQEECAQGMELIHTSYHYTPCWCGMVHGLEEK
jgi:hypothetical protein